MTWIHNLLDHLAKTLKEEISPIGTGIDALNKTYEQSAKSQKQLPRLKMVVKGLPSCNDLNEDRLIFWAGQYVNFDALQEHFMLLGAAGSGKTLLLDKNIYLVSSMVKPGSDTRMLVVDLKGNVPAMLEAQGVPFVYINPADLRGKAWDVAKDIGGNYERCRSLGYAIFPEVKDDVFWQNAARSICVGVLWTLVFLFDDKWDLSFLVQICRLKREQLIQFLELCPYTAGVVNRYLKNESENLLGSILSTLEDGISKLDSVAAHSEQADKVSIREDFLQSETRWVIGQDMETIESTKPYIQALIRFAIYMIAALPDSERRRIALFLDEFRMIGNMKGIIEAVVYCRSKGLRIFAATQSIPGLHDEFGKEKANDLLENFTIGVLKIKAAETALYAQALFGTMVLREEVSSMNSAKQGTSTGSQVQRVIRSRVLDSDFLNIHQPSETLGLSGIYRIGNDAVKVTLTGRLVNQLKTKRSDRAMFVPKKQQTILVPWDEKTFSHFMTIARRAKKHVQQVANVDTLNRLEIQTRVNNELMGIIEECLIESLEEYKRNLRKVVGE